MWSKKYLEFVNEVHNCLEDNRIEYLEEFEYLEGFDSLDESNKRNKQ